MYAKFLGCQVSCPLSHLLAQMPALPEGEPRSWCELHTCCIRLSLAQTCPRAAPSVTACAVPPSSGRKALVFRTIQTCLSLWERCRAATERACISYFFSRAYLIRICSRAALSVICFANASSPKGRAKKSVRTARLTHQATSHADLFACCSFRRGLRRATFLKEEGFGLPITKAALSGGFCSIFQSLRSK